MKKLSKILNGTLTGTLFFLITFSCTKDPSAEFYFWDLQPIDFEELVPVNPDFIWEQEIAGSPGGFDWNVQDYEVSLTLNSWQSETAGTQYGATIVLCNNGIKAIDTFQLDLSYKGSTIYSTWITPFTGACTIFYFSNFYKGSGSYEVSIRLPATHHDHNTANNKMSKNI